MQVSVIIPNLNSPLIKQVLRHLSFQTAREAIGEILIVGKDEPRLVQSNHIVRLLDTGRPVSAPAARNIGIRRAKHDLLMFLDSDCLPQPEWLAEHLVAQADGHAVVGGGVLPEGTSYWSLSYNLTMFHEFFATNPAGPRRYLPTLNLSVRREAIDAGGLFDESLARGQDIEWTIRLAQAGFQPYFWPDATVYHDHNRKNLGRVWSECARSGYYMRQIRLQNKNELRAPRLLRHRWLVLALSPLIATWATGRIASRHLSTFRRHLRVIPAIYLTKIAWCWGASRPENQQ
jgi:GT2 family glycosyltransferase